MGFPSVAIPSCTPSLANICFVDFLVFLFSSSMLLSVDEPFISLSIHWVMPNVWLVEIGVPNYIGFERALLVSLHLFFGLHNIYLLLFVPKINQLTYFCHCRFLSNTSLWPSKLLFMHKYDCSFIRGVNVQCSMSFSSSSLSYKLLRAVFFALWWSLSRYSLSNLLRGDLDTCLSICLLLGLIAGLKSSWIDPRGDFLQLCVENVLDWINTPGDFWEGFVWVWLRDILSIDLVFLEYFGALVNLSIDFPNFDAIFREFLFKFGLKVYFSVEFLRFLDACEVEDTKLWGRWRFNVLFTFSDLPIKVTFYLFVNSKTGSWLWESSNSIIIFETSFILGVKL